MAGPGTSYFTAKKNEWAPVVQAAIPAQAKLTAATTALQILSQTSISQAEAESLIDLYQKAQ